MEWISLLMWSKKTYTYEAMANEKHEMDVRSLKAQFVKIRF